MPPHERTRSQDILWLSARWGGAFTPLLVIGVMSWLSWRDTFVLFGAIGVLWAFVFYRSFRDQAANGQLRHLSVRDEGERGNIEPGEERPSNREPEGRALAREAALRRRGEGTAPDQRLHVPWHKLLCSRTVWLLWVQYFCLTYGWFFYVTWLPTYLKETRGLDLDQNALMLSLGTLLRQLLTPETTRAALVAALAGVPLFFGGLGAIVCGLVTPRLVRQTGSIALTRRRIALLGFTGAAALLVCASYIRDPLMAMLAMGLASFCNDLTMPGSWSTCMDVGAHYAGTLSGSMNMMGSIGAAVAPLAIGVILDSSGRNWTLTFWISGIIYFIGGLCWLWLDPVTPIAADEAQTIQ